MITEEKNYLLEGNKKSEKYEFKEAAEEYKQAIKVDSNNIEAYIGLGISLSMMNELDEAEKIYRQALAIDSTCKEVYSGIGNILLREERYEESLAQFNEIIRLGKADGYTHNSKGIVLQMMEKYGEAKESYKKALEYDSTDGFFKQNYENIEEMIKNSNCDKNRLKQIEETPIEERIKEVSDKNNFKEYQQEIDKRINEVENKEDRIKLEKLKSEIEKLREKLIYEDKKFIGHYTKIENIKKIIGTDKINLRICDIEYANDPEEGKILLKKLKEKNKKILEKIYESNILNGRMKVGSDRKIFTISLSESIDEKLPMWSQYTNDAEGCCLVFDREFFGENVELYEMKYLDLEENSERGNEENIWSQIEKVSMSLEVFNDIETFKIEKIYEIIKIMLDSVRFLFKDKAYEYEKEVRIIKSKKFDENEDEQMIKCAYEETVIPRLYIELNEKNNKIQEVIIGPKVEKIEGVANYIEYTRRVIDITKSRIKYR